MAKGREKRAIIWHHPLEVAAAVEIAVGIGAAMTTVATTAGIMGIRAVVAAAIAMVTVM